MNESFKTDPSLATSARAAKESGSYLCASNVTPTAVRFIVSVFLCLLCSCLVSSTQMTCSHFRKNRPKKRQKPAGCRSRIISKNRPVPIFGRSTGASLYNTIITLVEPINYNVEVWHLWHCINYVELFWPSSIKYVSDICFYFFCIVCKSVAPCCILMVICRTSHAEGIILFFKRLLFKNKMNSWNRIVIKAAISKPSSYLEASSNLIIFRSCHYTSQGLSGPLMFTHKHTHIHISFL